MVEVLKHLESKANSDVVQKPNHPVNISNLYLLVEMVLMILMQVKIASVEIQKICADLHKALKQVYLYVYEPPDSHHIFPLIPSLFLGPSLTFPDFFEELFKCPGCLLHLKQFFHYPSKGTEALFDFLRNQENYLIIDNSNAHTHIACASLNYLTSRLPRLVRG
jgi:hypothetical protein